MHGFFDNLRDLRIEAMDALGHVPEPDRDECEGVAEVLALEMSRDMARRVPLYDWAQ